MPVPSRPLPATALPRPYGHEPRRDVKESKAPPPAPHCAAPTVKGARCANPLSSCPWPKHQAYHLQRATAQQVVKLSDLCVFAAKPTTHSKLENVVDVVEEEVNVPHVNQKQSTPQATTTAVCTLDNHRGGKDIQQSAGKFYTVRHQYILQGLGLRPPPPTASVIEPFAGQGDLLDWLVSVGHQLPVEAYDIDPKHKSVLQRDTLGNPPDYKDKWIVTNPPYLARNQSTDKTYFDKYNANDLYKCFLSCLNAGDGCAGGVIIVPAGFFSSPSDRTCRIAFMRRYKLVRVNYFEEQVFPTTPTTVVAFAFVRSAEVLLEQSVEWVRYPSKEKRTFRFQAEHGWIVAGQIYRLPVSKCISVSRYVGSTLKEGQQLTSIHLYAIDNGSEDGRIRLEFDDKSKPHGDVKSRAKATLVVKGRVLTPTEQLSLCNRFNQLLERKRAGSWSLFLSQFRESKQYARKRITFELAYRIVQHLLS